MSGNDFLYNARSVNRQYVPRVHRFFEMTVPLYSMDDFKSHFRLSRGTYQTTSLRLGVLSEYNPTTGPTPDVEKDPLMFLWFIGKLINLILKILVCMFQSN